MAWSGPGIHSLAPRARIGSIAHLAQSNRWASSPPSPPRSPDLEGEPPPMTDARRAVAESGLDPAEIGRRVEEVLADPMYWYPVRHHSPTVARLLRAALRARRPKLILIEGPSEANDLIRHVVDPKTEPPIAIYSSYRDDDNVLGLNGVLSPAPDIPARFAVWYPLTIYSPEYVAMKTAQEIGAIHCCFTAPARPAASRRPGRNRRPRRTRIGSSPPAGFTRPSPPRPASSRSRRRGIPCSRAPRPRTMRPIGATWRRSAWPPGTRPTRPRSARARPSSASGISSGRSARRSTPAACGPIRRPSSAAGSTCSSTATTRSRRRNRRPARCTRPSSPTRISGSPSWPATGRASGHLSSTRPATT